MRKKVSETTAWLTVDDLADGIIQAVRNYDSVAVGRMAKEIKEIAVIMDRQVTLGIHTNPPLVIFGNPRRHANPLPGSTVRANEKLSNRVYELAYCHVDDGRDYKHKFAPGVQLYTATMSGSRVVVLSRPDGKKLWEDFD